MGAAEGGERNGNRRDTFCTGGTDATAELERRDEEGRASRTAGGAVLKRRRESGTAGKKRAAENLIQLACGRAGRKKAAGRKGVFAVFQKSSRRTELRSPSAGGMFFEMEFGCKRLARNSRRGAFRTLKGCIPAFFQLLRLSAAGTFCAPKGRPPAPQPYSSMKILLLAYTSPLPRVTIMSPG